VYSGTHFRFYEFPIENSNKSLGVYQVQNSVHYFLWSVDFTSHTTYDLDGKTNSVINLKEGRMIGSVDFGFIDDVNLAINNISTKSTCD
jgi:hypothetical protein